MKTSAVVLLFLFLATCCVRAQVAPSASGHTLTVQAGVEGSDFQPDYAGQGVAQASPDRLFGIGAYVDANFARWVQIEAEGRWLHWNQFAGVTQNTYMIGPRIPIVEDVKGFTPYGKFLFGWASMPQLTGRSAAWAYGGGVDYRLGNKFSLRCFDFEYQQWQTNPTHLKPWGGSVGLSYRVF